MKRRREGSRRLPALVCGHRDPLDASHRGGPAPWGYQPAVEHLDAAGLLAAPPADLDQLRQLWRDGNAELAAAITAAWQVSA